MLAASWDAAPLQSTKGHKPNSGLRENRCRYWKREQQGSRKQQRYITLDCRPKEQNAGCTISLRRKHGPSGLGKKANKGGNRKNVEPGEKAAKGKKKTGHVGACEKTEIPWEEKEDRQGLKARTNAQGWKNGTRPKWRKGKAHAW